MVSKTVSKPPHELDLVIDFVNTLDPDEDSDDFAMPEGLRGWLTERQLLDAHAAPLGEAERGQAVREQQRRGSREYP